MRRFDPDYPLMISIKKIFKITEVNLPHDVEIALGKLELLVRDEGVEAKDIPTQIEMIAWDSGYQNRPLLPWLKVLGKHFKVDADAAFKQGLSSRE